VGTPGPNLDAQRVLRFLRYNEPASFIGLVIVAYSYVEARDARLGVLLVAVLLNWLMVRRAQRLLKRERIASAVVAASTGMWACALAIWITVPPAYGLALLIGSLPIMLAAAYVRGGIIPIILCSVAVAAVGGIYYLKPVLAVEVPPTLLAATIVFFAPALTVSCALAVWHSTRRLLELVDETSAANRALEESERTLEQKVEERTAALGKVQDRIAGELRDAADYVRSVLPAPLKDVRGVDVEWCFQPSDQLGGDAFTYFWLDENRFAIALLDVCGHGVSPALHGMAAIHAVRSWAQTRSVLDDPAAVLRALNESFSMETHDDLFMTVWYGIFDLFQGRLQYASGGHPPAVLMTGDSLDDVRTVELKGSGPIVGVLADSHYTTRTLWLGRHNDLFIYSDGVFEITRPDGSMLAWSDFVSELQRPHNGSSKTHEIRSFCQHVSGREAFDDDFLLLHVSFRPPVGGWMGRARGRSASQAWRERHQSSSHEMSSVRS
jgi:serine phosphatase RsbU (regulator of sigma subunit)